MKADRARAGLAVIALAVLPALACTAEARKETGREAEKKAEELGKAAEEKAGEAGRKIEEAAEDIGGKVDAAKQLADVKMALMADTSVDASNINVDSDEATKTIHLRGTVPSSAQKAAAERIAREKAEGYKIHNMLTVAPKPPASKTAEPR